MVTEELNFDGQRICAVPDHLGNDGCLWPFKDVKIHVSGRLGNLNLPDCIEQCIKDPRGWNGVCGTKLQLWTNPKTANLAVNTGGIDGPGKILGWCELPCGFTPQRIRQLKMLLDDGDLFVFAENPPSNRIDLGAVWNHEVGHGIGISHINPPNNLMNPTYRGGLRWPQRDDILEARLRYGLAEPTPSPPPTDDPDAPTDPSGPSALSPCVSELTSEERALLLRVGLKALSGIWRQLSPDEKRLVAELRAEAFRVEQ